MIRFFAGAAARFGINPKEAERFTKFLVVGTLGFVIDFGTLTFLVEVVDLPGLIADNTQYAEIVGLVLANTISFTLAVISNFTLNRLWTYPESRSVRKRVQLPQFTAVSIAGLLINNLIFVICVPLFDQLITTLTIIPDTLEAYIPAKVVATVVVLFWNFFVNRYWTYKHIDG
jgi:putative flippase GtrA